MKKIRAVVSQVRRELEYTLVRIGLSYQDESF